MNGKDFEHAEMFQRWKPEWNPPLKHGYELRDHQKAGVAFLHYCKDAYGFALLGDRMGVGKVCADY
jgi:hypothetical protein